MDILLRNIPDNYDEVRDRTSLPKPQFSRASSIFLTKSLVVYHKRIEYNNSLNEDINMEDDSSQLSYTMPKEKANHVSTVADSNDNMMNMYVLIKHPTSSPPHVNDYIINIQLSYNPNASMEPKL